MSREKLFKVKDAMRIDEFEEVMDIDHGFCGDYIVTILLHYVYEEEYTEINELLHVGVENTYWENDWCECAEDVWVIGMIDVDDVETLSLSEYLK